MSSINTESCINYIILYSNLIYLWLFFKTYLAIEVMKTVIAAESATYVEILHWQKQNLMAFMVEFAIYYAWWLLRGNCNFVVVIFKHGIHSVATTDSQ